MGETVAPVILLPLDLNLTGKMCFLVRAQQPVIKKQAFKLVKLCKNTEIDTEGADISDFICMILSNLTTIVGGRFILNRPFAVRGHVTTPTLN